MADDSKIQGRILEVTVVGCTRLKDTEWISRQDPYVCLEYATSKFRTRTCTDGGRNPSFNEKYTFTLVEGLREMNVSVWNHNTMHHDAFIASGKVLLQPVLCEGFDNRSWTLQTRSGKTGGEIQLVLKYKRPKRSKDNTPPYPPATPSHPSVPPPSPLLYPYASFSQAPALMYAPPYLPQPQPPPSYAPPLYSYPPVTLSHPSYQPPYAQPYTPQPPLSYASPQPCPPQQAYPTGSYYPARPY